MEEMMASGQLVATQQLRIGQPIPIELNDFSRDGSRPVYLASQTVNKDQAALIDYTPQLQDLVSSILPLALHVAERNHIGANQPLYMFYVNPNESLADNGDRLVDFLRGLSGSDKLWMPISTNSSIVLHTLKRVLPSLGLMNLASVTMIYIGESALRQPMSFIADATRMNFCFHALY